jgi:HSP20 family molecular chaperone IbpA
MGGFGHVGGENSKERSGFAGDPRRFRRGQEERIGQFDSRVGQVGGREETGPGLKNRPIPPRMSPDPPGTRSGIVLSGSELGTGLVLVVLEKEAPMKSLIDLNLLKLVARREAAAVAQPVHALMETHDHFSIYLNLWGIAREDIALALNERKRELTVIAKREGERMKTGHFWMFAVPKEGELSKAELLYRTGAVEIRIPKIAA